MYANRKQIKAYALHCLLPLALCFLPFLLRGQIKKKGEDQTKDVPPERIVKASPLAILDPFGPTLAAYYEQQLPSRKKWTSVESEIGYTFRITGLTNAALGYRLRGSYRQYFKNKWQAKNNNYLSLAAMHRQIFDKGIGFLWREGRSYQQNLDYRLQIAQQSVTLNAGTTRYFGAKDRFNLDVSFGLGLRRTHILFKNLPTDAITPNIPDLFEKNFKEYLSETTLKNRTHYFFNTAIGVKVGYVLQKNALARKKHF